MRMKQNNGFGHDMRWQIGLAGITLAAYVIVSGFCFFFHRELYALSDIDSLRSVYGEYYFYFYLWLGLALLGLLLICVLFCGIYSPKKYIKNEIGTLNESLKEIHVDFHEELLIYKEVRIKCRQQVLLLMNYMVEHPERYVRKDDFNDILGDGFYVAERSGSVHKIHAIVSDVRKVLADMPFEIVNVKGLGYKIVVK